MSTFRPLNQNELMAIGSAQNKGKIPEFHPLVSSPESAKVSYESMQGGFCICIIIVQKRTSSPDYGYLVFRGASRRSYKDLKNNIMGEMLAFNRAILYSRPVELG